MRWLPFVAAMAASLLTAGCEFADWGDSQRFKEDFHKSFEVSPGGSLSIDNANGSIEIAAWDKDSVEVNGTKYGPTESAMKEVRVDISTSGNSIRIRTITPANFNHRAGAQYMIRVPGNFNLDRIESTNGHIRVESVAGDARLKTTNGSINTSRLDGRLDLETTNGSVEVQDQKGKTTARTTNGRITADGVSGAFEAQTTNGSIHVRLVDPAASVPIKVSTKNGSIELSLNKLRNNEIHATTTNSSITLRLPSTANAQVHAHTSNSRISTEFDLTTTGSISKHELSGTIGSGGPLIELGTTNGSVKILKI